MHRLVIPVPSDLIYQNNAFLTSGALFSNQTMSIDTFPRQDLATSAGSATREENLAVAEGLKRQDAGLLDELIVRYQHRLLRYLLYLTGNREMAEDIFQEVWMRVMVRGAQFNGQARFDTWLFTIARNLVIDQRRKRTMASLDDLFEGSGDDDHPMAFEIAGDEPTPFDHLSSLEDRQRIAAALLELDTIYREVLVLRFHEDLSLEEISKVIQSPVSTVKSRLYRGLAAIKRKLERTRLYCQEVK
jgi:RNA polymerase sigma-70 factor (ECF subfamily)